MSYHRINTENLYEKEAKWDPNSEILYILKIYTIIFLSNIDAFFSF
jgi:hypothetical protein